MELQCRRRKVRCNGQHPCVSCRKSALECTYPAPPGKRGRKFRSQRPLQSVQDHLQRSATPSVFCEKLPESPLIGVAATFDSGSVDDGSQNRSPSSGSSPSMVGHDGLIMPELEPSPGSMSFYELQLGHSLWEETAAQATRQLPPVVFDSYLELFFQHIHPIMPVLDRRKYLDPSFLSGPTLPPDEYCLLTSLAALTTAQLQLPRQTPDFGPSDTFLLPGEYFVRECLQHRCKNDFIGNPSLAAITTSFLLFGYFGNLDQPATAWYYLREAITFCQMLGLDREDLTSRLPKSTAQQHRKMFWLLYITERYCSSLLASSHADGRRGHTLFNEIIAPHLPHPLIFRTSLTPKSRGFCTDSCIWHTCSVRSTKPSLTSGKRLRETRTVLERGYWIPITP